MRNVIGVLAICCLAGCTNIPQQPPPVIGEYQPVNQPANRVADTAPKFDIACTPQEQTNWEILDADGTLQNTLNRWARSVNWEVSWESVPEIQNPGYVKLPNRDFLAATDYVMTKAKLIAQKSGLELSAIAHTNRVLVITAKESKK